ncbi:MAG: hypothetical protein AAGB34_00585 [Planctomycetota bacterium]
MLSLHTIRQGDRLSLWSRDGRFRFVDGPRRIWTFREHAEPTKRHSVELGQFLVVHNRDGHVEHIAGPAELWEHPVDHIDVQVARATALDSHEALVVYSRDENGTVKRRVLNGPLIYVPQPGEWVHEFSWHGTSTINKRLKEPHALKFTKLRVIPDQTYVYVPDVRTSDDALLTLQVMVFFELTDIDTMLDRTHDPIADFCNAISSDLVELAASRSFQELKRDTEMLSELSSYENLTARAESIGYRISKVVYRGYEAGDRLQAMHDEAIESRTALQLDRETQDQAQELEDVKLDREAARARTRREIEQQQAEHERGIARATHEEQIRQRREEVQQQADAARTEHQVEIELLKAKAEERMAFLESIAGLQVDLTQYLVASFQSPDRLVRIEGGSSATPLLHLFPDGAPSHE